MPLREGRAVSARPHAGPENTPRLRLKRKAPVNGHVDGAWWPHNDDLQKELADLLAVLSVRLGAISRVMYNRAEWAKAPPKLRTGGQAVRLDGYHRQPPNTLEVLAANRNKIVLLVVPVHTDPDHAHAIVMAAAASNNASSVENLLMISVQDREGRTRTTTAPGRRESQGEIGPSTVRPGGRVPGVFAD
jgi:Family of unknown function (DUF5994)